MGRSGFIVRGAGLGLAVALLVVVVVWTVLWTVDTTSYDIWGGLVVGAAVLLLTWPLARHAARIEGDRRLALLIMLAVVLKLFSACVRYFVAVDIYGGSADAGVYIREGGWFAENLRQGMILYEPQRGGSSGTHFIRQLTGWVFLFTGTTAIGGYFAFAWFGFLGQYFAYRAFRVGVPHGLHRRYGLLVFFLPTLLYWPASIGKEAWMLLTLGLGAYGVARILTHRPDGYVLFALGLVGTAAVRPHVTAILAAALAASFLLRRSRTGSFLGFGAKIVGTILVFSAALWAFEAAEERFGVSGEGLSGAEQVIEETAEGTRGGGSEFEPTNPTSIADVPRAVFTVMFRPLPHEAHNLQALATSMEGVLLLLLFVVSWPRLRRLPREALQTPYVMFAVSYSLMFMVAFASIGNFGILARQRAQLFPWILLILALPSIKEATSRSTTSRRGTHAPKPVLLPVAPPVPRNSVGHDETYRSPSRIGQGETYGSAELIIDLPRGSTRIDPPS